MRKTVNEIIEEISKVSGLSENIVRRVLSAEREVVLNSLVSGYKVTLIGRCSIEPEVRSKLGIGGTLDKYVKLKCKVVPSLEEDLNERVIEGYTEEIEEGLLVEQIEGLL
ncbi:MAG: hypothetical protein QXD03_02500 [Candidatus Anstonellales archaeon]